MFISTRKCCSITLGGLLLARVAAITAPAMAEEVSAPAQPESVARVEPAPGRWIYSPQAALNAPQPIQVGVEAFRAENDRLRVFGNIGYAMYPFTSADKSFNIFSVQAGARFFPWNKKFFGSAGVGYRHLGFTTNVSNYTIDGEVIATGATLDFKTFYAVVAIGAEFPLSDRLDFGFDIGAQFGLLGSGSPTLFNKDTGADSSNSEVLSVGSDTFALDRLARIIVPQITLARLTWRFD